MIGRRRGDEDELTAAATEQLRQSRTIDDLVSGPFPGETADAGDPLSLDNGKIDGGKFSFDVSFNGITIHNDCTINADDTIKLNSAASDGSFPPSEFMLKRVKADAPAPAPTPKPGI